MIDHGHSDRCDDSRDRDREASLYFDGRVAGNTMEGEGVRGVGNQQARFKWRAVRTGDLKKSDGKK